jgi:hypothetical protein
MKINQKKLSCTGRCVIFCVLYKNQLFEKSTDCRHSDNIVVLYPIPIWSNAGNGGLISHYFVEIVKKRIYMNFFSGVAIGNLCCVASTVKTKIHQTNSV